MINMVTCVSTLIVMLTLTFSATFAQPKITEAPPDTGKSLPDSITVMENSVGVGFGNPYGFLGANIDVNALKNLNVSAGLGTPYFGIAYNLGVKYFLVSVRSAFRPRISFYCGNNNWLVKQASQNSTNNETITYLGFAFGVGMQWMFEEKRKHGFDFDIFFVPNMPAFSDQVEQSLDQELLQRASARIGFSLGYRYAF